MTFRLAEAARVIGRPGSSVVNLTMEHVVHRLVVIVGFVVFDANDNVFLCFRQTHVLQEVDKVDEQLRQSVKDVH